jgi:tetratricopeptide (TPR) repeat protein
MEFRRVSMSVVLLAASAVAQAFAQQPPRPATGAAATCTPQQAMAAEQKQDWTGAIHIYTCLSQASPQDWRPVNAIAGDYGMLNRPADEIQWAQRASALAPQQAEPYLNLGNAQAAMKNTAAAEAAFTKAMQVAPTWPIAPYSLGVLAEEQQNAQAAEQWYRKALAIDPNFEDAEVSLAALLGNTNRVAQAIPILQKVVAANPQAQDAKQMLDDMQHGGPRNNGQPQPQNGQQPPPQNGQPQRQAAPIERVPPR